MNRRELIDFCLTFPDAYEDQPFRDDGWTVVRHQQNRKVFAWVYERDGHLCVNLKCEPMKADFLRNVYSGVKPGYHLNKTHWNTVIIDSDVPEHELSAMVQDSHKLTRLKKR